MPDHVITGVDQVTPDWLTAVLSRSGALAKGEVTAFEADTGGGNWSDNARLSLRYSPDATGDRPEYLFLKLCNTDLGDDEYFSGSEVNYYLRDYIDVPDAPLIRCYDGAYSEALQRYHLLLDDVSSTHEEAYRQTPTLDYGLALADGLAAMHARWWGAERLAEIGEPIHGPDHIRRFLAIAEPGAGHISAALPDELEPNWPAVTRELFARMPDTLIRRTANANGFTIIHGDAGQTNIMVPREGVGTRAGVPPIYLIDRQPFDWSLTTWLGVYDLMYALVLDWEIDLRRQWEEPVLRRYHKQLLARGVAGYAWERLWDDYRLCVALGVTIATEYCRGGLNERQQWVWLPMLRRALTACDDIDCRALWQNQT